MCVATKYSEPGRLMRWVSSASALAGENMAPERGTSVTHKLPDDVTAQLRHLAHDLSNSIETIMQASYLIGQTKLENRSKKWIAMIDEAVHDAARINRSLREILRAQNTSQRRKRAS